MGDVAGVMNGVKGLSDEERSQVVLETIASGSVIWLSNLKKQFETKFGVTAAVAMAAGPAAAGPAAAAAPEAPTSFDVILEPSTPDKKIGVIKVVRTMTDLGLKEAKQLVDEAPKTLKTGLSKEDAEKVKKEIEAAGGVCKIKGS
ncbi:MAG: large subunit ribosomal protein [Planctomycetota bacterium]|nr:MAG: large subunit ribosomal protein [Planctomycetota bacterium]